MHKLAVLLTFLAAQILIPDVRAGFKDWARNVAKAEGFRERDDAFKVTKAYVPGEDELKMTTIAQLIQTSSVSPNQTIKCNDDLAWDCMIKSAQCKVPVYFNLMNRLCQTTCDMCKCVDRDPRCPTFVKNGFCNIQFYGDHIRRLYCAKSCDVC